MNSKIFALPALTIALQNASENHPKRAVRSLTASMESTTRKTEPSRVRDGGNMDLRSIDVTNFVRNLKTSVVWVTFVWYVRNNLDHKRVRVCEAKIELVGEMNLPCLFRHTLACKYTGARRNSLTELDVLTSCSSLRAPLLLTRS